MESKINIAELLRDCPKGMELDCAIWDNCTFEGIEDVGYINILVKTPNGLVKLSKEGHLYHNHSGSKCVIFPKGKTTWEGFVPPIQFKDGDIIFTNTNALKCNLENSWVSIFKEYRNNRCACYVCLCLSDLELYHDKWEDELLCELCEIEENRLATEEEKQKLFDTIKANGYRWNAETKTLEELLKFKVGDRVKRKEVNYTHIVTIVEIDGEYYTYVNQNGEPASISIKNQDKWELVPNKFDINTLVPFESRVLIRDAEGEKWNPAIWGYYDTNNTKYYPYETVGGNCFQFCIPYEDNEHLLGTTDDCDEFYKTWK